MKLKTITIENFRCFSQLTLDLHPELTVLIAPNGAVNGVIKNDTPGPNLLTNFEKEHPNVH